MESLALNTFPDPETLEKSPLEWAALFAQRIAESVSDAMEKGELVGVMLDKLEQALTVVHEVSSSIPNTTALTTSVIKRMIRYIIARRKKQKVTKSHT
jgi:hypothetical protein